MSLSLTRCVKYEGSAVPNCICRGRSGLQGGISIPAESIRQMPHRAKLKGGLAPAAARASSTPREKLGSAGVGLACPGQRRNRNPACLQGWI